MDLKEVVVKQRVMRSMDMRELVDFKETDRVDIYHAYASAALFTARELNVAAGLGIPALNAVAEARIRLSAVMPVLGNLVFAGLTHLASDVSHWRFDGSPSFVAEGRSWLTDCSAEMRKHRVNELLGISQRRSSRFVLVSGDHTTSVANDIENAFGAARRPITTVLDAWAFADKLKEKLSGVFFTVETKGEKRS